MTIKKIKKSTIDTFFNGLKNTFVDYKIAALTKKENKILFDYVEDVTEIERKYTPTVLSPKKFFFPQKEVLLEYTAELDVKAKLNPEKLILFGVKPCDITGIKLMDEAFAEGNGDPNYLSKRQNSIIIGIDCKEICSEDAFCYKVNSQNPEDGFDIMLQEFEDYYIINIATNKGELLINKFFEVEECSDCLQTEFKEEKKSTFKKAGGIFENLDNLPEIFEKNTEHKIWEQEAERCLSCGSCVMVCPTCYCFNVNDDYELNMKTGKRTRTWDACMVKDFAIVAGGENFREKPVSRLKHRISRKFNYLMRKHGQPVCIGCGRCVRACLADISPVTIVEEVQNAV